MAYWNPQKEGNRYYDPYYQAQEPGPSLGQSLMGVAKTMVVIGGLNLIGGAAGKWFSRKAGMAIKKHSKGHLSSIARNMKRPTLGGILQRTKTFKRISAPLKRTSVYKSGQTRARQLATLKGKPGYGLARVTTAFKNPKTFLAATAGVWKQNVLSGIGVAYAIDSLLGVTTRDLGLEKKAWYDVPGQLSNFGKWMVNDSIAGLAIGGVMRMGGALGSAGYLGMKRAFGGEFGKHVMGFAAAIAQPRGFLNKDIQYRTRGGSEASVFTSAARAGIRSAQERKASSNIVMKALHFAKSMPEVMRSANASIKVAPNAFNSAQGNFGVRTKKAINVVNSAIRGALSASQSRTKAAIPETRLSGLKAIQAIHQLALDSQANPSKGENLALLTPSFRENFLDKIEHANNKKSFMQEVFGFLKPLRNQDVIDKDFFEETAGALTQRYHRSEVDILMKHIKNMRVGSDIYVGSRAKGGGVDLSIFNPVLAMKRGASVVANARFRIPLTKWDFTVGDLTGVNKYLSEAPSFEFFKKRPAIALDDPRMNQVSVGDLSPEGEDPLFWYHKGDWAVFDGGNVRAVQTNSILRYAPQASRDKKLQLRSVNAKRWREYAKQLATDDGKLDTEKAAAIYNTWKQKWEHREAPTNKFLHFLNTKLNMTVPGAINRMASAIENSLGGTAKKYQLAASYAQGAGEWMPGKAYASLPFLEEAYNRGSQVFSRILHNKHALDRIGAFSGAQMREDLLEIAYNDVHLMKAFDEIDWTAARWQGRGDFHRAVEDIRVNPTYARSHHATKRMGDLSEMTSYDIARVNLIEDRLNSNYDIFAGNGKEHPIMAALPSLQREGHITAKEANALSLWAKLSAFRDKGLFKHTGDPDGAPIKGEWLKVLKRVRDTAKESNWNLEQEMLTFAKDFELKHPGIRASQARMLRDRGEIPTLLSDTSPYVSVRKGAGAILDIARSAMDSTTDLLSEFIPVAKREFTHNGIRGNLRYVGNVVGLTAAAGLIYRTADTLTAANPLFEDTPLDDGITGAGADVIARARLGLAHVGDLTGITPTMKYLHGLAPKSESFVPGAFLGTVAGMSLGGPLKAMKYAAWGGIVNRLASPYLPDLTKSHEEMERIYSGEDMVPVFKSPTWLLGGTPWEGTKVAAYQPNWYVRAKSRWEESGTLYGSAFRRLIHKPLPLLGTNIGDIVDPYYMELQHFFSRPYPTCFFGDTLVSTTNGIKEIKEIKIDDEVYDINGDVTKIVSTSSRETTTLDKCIEITTVGNLESIKVTDTHRFPVIPKIRCKYPSLKNKDCISSTKGICKRCSKRINSIKWSWVAGKDINEGDFIVKPIINPSYFGEIIDPTKYVSRPYKLIDNNIVLIDKRGNKTKNIFPNNNIKITSDLAKYFGLYLSEGWIVKTRGKNTGIGTVHNIKEYDYVISIIKSIQKIFSFNYRITIKDNYFEVVICSWILSDIIYKLFGIHSHKKNPFHFTKNIDRFIVSGILFGDGHYDKNNIVLTGTSLNILNYVQNVFEINRIPVCIKKHCNNGKQSYRLTIPNSYIDDYKYKFETNYKNIHLKSNKIRNDKVIFHDNLLLKKVVKIMPIPTPEKVYDLTILNDNHAFVLISISAHNSGKAFGEVPLIGNLLSATVGRIIKPEKTMHQEFLYADTHTQHGPSANSPFAITPPSYGTAKTLMKTRHGSPRSTAGIANSGGEIILPAGKAWSETAAEDFLYDAQAFAGLKGFMAGAVSERIFGRETVIPTLQQAGRMASMSREFYDKNLGGMGVITEPIRRLIDKPEYRQYGINPIPNLMPNWLPARFLTGDPYEQIMRGELRLPGEAYSRTHPTLRRTMPARASMIGGYESDIIKYFTGLLPPMLKQEYEIMETGTEMHEQIQDYLAAENLLVSCENLVIDVENDITGHVDAIIRDGTGGRGRKALEIKTIGQEALAEMDGPKYQHVGQINFYLRQLGLKQGTIMYIARENPAMVRTFDVNYSENRFQKDLRKLKKARAVAADMMTEGMADTYGHSYSWIDRLKILADVAPSSKEYNEAKQIVQAQLKGGKLTQKEITEYKKAMSHRQARLRTYELYPDRFRGQLFSPSTQYNAQSINEDIKAAAEYSLPERAIGWIWEHFTNSNNIISNKLFAVKDPLEHYQMTRLYGKEYKPWNEPIRSWLEPYSRGLISKTNPVEGTLSFGTGGFVLGGPIGAIAGAFGGAAYGTAHGLFRWATGTTYIPNIIDDRREIDSYFDAAKYAKLGRMADLSAGLTKQKFLDAQASTLTALNAADNSSAANLFRATPYTEKPYIEAFLNERDPRRRQEILNYVPEDLGMALSKQWAKHEESVGTSNFVDNTSQDIAAGRKGYAFNEQILDPRVNLEDVKLKVVESRGYAAHEFGLGWNEQMLRIQNSVNTVHDINRAQYTEIPTAPSDVNPGQVRGSILNLIHNNGLKGNANVYINNGREGPNAVVVKIRRDRARSVVTALRNRKKYTDG